MKIYLKYNYPQLTKKILQDQLSELGYKFKINGFGEFVFLERIPSEKMKQLTEKFQEYGIEIIENQKSVLAQKIKDTIFEMVNSDTQLIVKSSVYISEKLNLSYVYLSSVFSEVTYTSIENYIIIQKIELAKQLIINTNMNLTEISIQLNYSSIAHLSSQFKNNTGMTPSAFQRIILKRKEFTDKNNS